MPRSEAPLETRVAAAQVDALFNVITLGVCGAGISAVILVTTLERLGATDTKSGIIWTTYILSCALAHIALRHVYERSRPIGARWRTWAFLFTAIAFAEGLGWGWSPIWLVSEGRFDIELVALLTTLGVSAGAITGFSPYLPAFFAIFLPATLPYALTSALSSAPLHFATMPLMVVFIGAMTGLAVAANRSFKQLVRLRFRTEELARDLHLQKNIAEEANHAKSAFLAAASHDLRQPVHALGLFVGALRGVQMAPEGLKIVEQVETSIDAMDDLFTALLDISRLDAGTVEIHRHSFAIDPLIERICQDYIADAKAKNVGLIWRTCSAYVDTDPVHIERILRNLISNAVRYTDSGRILVGCRKRGTRISLQVWDTGRGIAPDQHERIFREYYQIGNPERDRTKGLGLGLAIVERLSVFIDCPLKLTSRVGHGSCFEIMVPLTSSGTRAAQPASIDLAGALVPGFIVVIDDELAIREAMSRLLTGWGHDVVVSASGDEALHRLSASPVSPDLIICDYRLRDDDSGINVIERLRSEYNRTIPAMLLTGDTAPDRLIEARKSGLLLLHKPVSNAKLRAAIVNLMRNARVADSSDAIKAPSY